MVPICWWARSPSSRSASIRGLPLENTSSGILRLVSKPLPGKVFRSFDRAVRNSSWFLLLASMMNPRSAPLTEIAESITRVSTSSSTRAELTARSDSSKAAS